MVDCWSDDDDLHGRQFLVFMGNFFCLWNKIFLKRRTSYLIIHSVHEWPITSTHKRSPPKNLQVFKNRTTIWHISIQLTQIIHLHSNKLSMMTRTMLSSSRHSCWLSIGRLWHDLNEIFSKKTHVRTEELWQETNSNKELMMSLFRLPSLWTQSLLDSRKKE